MPRKKRPTPVLRLDDVLTAYLLDMQARNLSPETQRMATQIMGWFSGWLTEQGHAVEIADIRKEQVQSYIRHCLDTVKPMTADVRFRQHTLVRLPRVDDGFELHLRQRASLYQAFGDTRNVSGVWGCNGGHGRRLNDRGRVLHRALNVNLARHIRLKQVAGDLRHF